MQVGNVKMALEYNHPSYSSFVRDWLLTDKSSLFLFILATLFCFFVNLQCFFGYMYPTHRNTIIDMRLYNRSV